MSKPYHAHIYYTAESRPSAAALREALRALPEVHYAGALRDAPVGPHPIPQFEVHFDDDGMPAVEPLLAGSGLRVLIHPLTNDDLADHTTLGRWIGEPVVLDLTVLDPPGHNQGVARFGKTDF